MKPYNCLQTEELRVSAQPERCSWPKDQKLLTYVPHTYYYEGQSSKKSS
jgi:hypothetical protein